MTTLVLFVVFIVLLGAFGGYIGLLEWLARRKDRKLSALLGVVSPPEDKNE